MVCILMVLEKESVCVESMEEAFRNNYKDKIIYQDKNDW